MKRMITGVILVMLLLIPVACAKAPESAQAPMPAPAPAPAPKTSSMPAPAISVPPPPMPSPAPAPSEDKWAEQSWAGERMIVRTGEMSLMVADVSIAIKRIAGFAESYDGYVVSSNSWREGDRLVGNIAIRVDAERFDDAIRALRQLAVEVIQESTSSKDVTEEYIDLEAKLSILEVTEVKLKQLMEEAKTVEESLDVNRELYRIQSEIEQTKGRMQYLEQTSSMSLIQVRLEQAELDVSFTAGKRTVKVGQDIRFEPRIGGGISPYSYEWDFGDGNTSTDVVPIHAYKSEGSYTVILKVTDDRGNWDTKERGGYIDVLPGWSAGNTASSAWNGLATFGRVLVDIIIWVGYFSPLWIIIGVILYFAWWRRRKKKV